MLNKILTRLNDTFGKGLKREPQQFLYVDKKALYEHFKAITGMNRVPVGISQATGASAGANLFGVSIGTSGNTSTAFDISESHLFESLEPVLREKYQEVSTETEVVATIRNFAWFRGALSWLHVGPTKTGDRVLEEARTFYTLEVNDIPFCLACDLESFSPFAPFLFKEPYLYNFYFDVEILAYNTGVLMKYGQQVHERSGRTMLLAPTVILDTDTRTNEEIAAWLREFNQGVLSKGYRD